MGREFDRGDLDAIEPMLEVLEDARRTKGLEESIVIGTSLKEKATEGSEEASDITGSAELRCLGADFSRAGRTRLRAGMEEWGQAVEGCGSPKSG